MEHPLSQCKCVSWFSVKKSEGIENSLKQRLKGVFET
jgi:hypothetical protein